MTKSYLFPTMFRPIGYAIMAIGVVLFVLMFIIGPQMDPEWEIMAPVFSLTKGIYEFEIENAWYPHVMQDDISFELVMVMMCVGCVFVAFSKEKDEDECIAQMRMNSIMWALLIGMVFVVLSTLFIYGWPYLWFMALYPIATFLLFIIIYNVSLYNFRNNND